MSLADELKKVYYENGNLKKTTSLKSGKKHGYEKMYYENGRIKYSAPYVNGVVHGEYKHFHPNGRIKAEVTFINGKEHGVAKEYFEDGNLDIEIVFKNGVAEGEFRLYHDNGNLKASSNLKNDEIDGLVELFFENGNKKEEYLFVFGKETPDSHKYFNNNQEIELQIDEKKTTVHSRKERTSKNQNTLGTHFDSYKLDEKEQNSESKVHKIQNEKTDEYYAKLLREFYKSDKNR